MRARFYTLMVVPHQGRRMRSVVLSRRFVVTLTALVLLLAGGGLLAPRLWLSQRFQTHTIEALRGRNAALSASLSDVSDRLVTLRGQMDYYEQQAQKLALLAGLDPLPGALAAAGGAPSAEQALRGDVPPGVRGVLEELDSLAVREESLTESFTALAAGYDKLESDLESIPSISPLPAGYFGSRYGWRKDPFTGRRVFHQGQDIVAPSGTPILAPARGRVSRAGRLGGLGNCVTIVHGNGLSSRYGHMSR
ncbi:MAG: M23 family metallopeptidase, partial [Acidobacteriota bacterium]